MQVKKKAQSINKPPLYFFFSIVFELIFLQSFSQSTPWAAPKDADNLKNAIAGNMSYMSEAKGLYIANCAPCHGDKGRGDGPAAAGLNPRPADHSSSAVQGESDGALFWKLSEGRAPMPAYKKIFTDQQRWELINYIRTLAKNPKKT
jgi:mono/diheme cytochrome c family protein